jgi:translin
MPSPYFQDFAAVSAKALEAFGKKHAHREQGLRISREVIRLSANAIRAVHRGEYQRAQDLICEAKASLKQTAQLLEESPEIYHAGFLVESRKEFSEANLTLAFVSGNPIPQPEDLGIDAGAYLKGLGDAAGELRRYILDSLRKDDWSRCEETMEVLDEILGLLMTMDFPEGVTGGLRHSTDMVRSTLERTRGDFTMALRQRELEKKLASWENNLSGNTAENTDDPPSF